MKRSIALSLVIVLAALINSAVMPIKAFQQNSPFKNSAAHIHFDPPEAAEASTLVLYQQDLGIGCREATAEEAERLSLRDPSLILHPISHTDPYPMSEGEEGLKIMLRATPRLEQFPNAKDGYLRAAAVWENRIQTPVTIVIDVDYGPTNFGVAWNPGVLGAAQVQNLTSSNVYQSVRSQLIAGASDEQESSVFNALPVDSLPTDLGRATTMTGPSATARALGLIDAAADPEGRERNLGKPPSIGINSSGRFDFFPSDGIEPDRVDFEAVALHEIGHILGFISSTGWREVDSAAPISPSAWDLYRLRPGTPTDAFSTAPRVLSSGGEQVFAVMGLEVPLSTGRPNGTGGDGAQASHWKNDALNNNRYIGVMDTGIPNGRRDVMTSFDLLALKMMGYRLKTGIKIAPEIGDFGGRMQSDVLTITGRAANIEAGTIYAEVRILNEAGAILTEYPLAAFDPGKLPVADFVFQFSAINQWRAAAHARLTLLNDQGSRSTALTENILKGDSGGPSLSSLSFNGKILKIKGKHLNGMNSLEVNGDAVTITSITVKGNGKKAQVEATATEMQLSGGPNRVRVTSNGLRSNAVILNL